MTHTLPDYSTKYKLTTIFGQIDTGELAARLGSIDTFDRRGCVMWMDDFENNLNSWQLDYTGLGTTVITNTQQRFGASSMYMDVGLAVNDVNSAYRYLPFRAVSKMGLETAFQITAVQTTLWFWIDWLDGTTRYRGQIYYNQGAGNLRYLNSGLGDTSFANVTPLLLNSGMFHIIKIVIDPTDYTFNRIILDNNTWDLSNIPLPGVADATSPCIRVGFKIQNGQLNAHQEMYIDGVIVTDNEP